MARRTQQDFDRLVEKYRPKHWRVRVTKGKIPCEEQDDPAGLTVYSSRTIWVHPVVDLKTLQVYLHEVAHVHLHLPNDENRIKQEYEAEMWSFAAMVNEKLPVTSQMIRDAKTNLLGHIKKEDTWQAIKWALDL